MGQGSRLNIVIIPEDGGRIRSIRLPVFSVYALGGMAVAFLGFLLSAVGVYWNAREIHRKWAVVQAENQVLQEQLASFREDLARLEEQLAENVRRENRARLLAGMVPLDEETRQLGIGGPDLAEPPPSPSPGLSKDLQEVDRRLDALRRQLRFQEESYDRIIAALEKRSSDLEHTPSIVPVCGDYYLSSGFGRRPDPFTGRYSMHEGYDFSAPEGTPFCATAAGEVVFAGRNGDFGLTVKVDHGNGLVTVYAHAARIAVKKGQKVERGQTLGYVGSTGRSTGPHIHYEVHRDGRPVNPGRYILDDDRIVD
jgi:murein DD-endopeptidase MepM/ murein hydrolase activator NlpD